jgi:hypothetical protein
LDDTAERLSFDARTAQNATWTGCALRSPKLNCLLYFEEAPSCSLADPVESCADVCALATERHNALELERSEVRVLANECQTLFSCERERPQCTLIAQIDDRCVVAGEGPVRDYDCERGPGSLVCEFDADAGVDQDDGGAR